jgi:hypothetical protein
MPRLKNRAVLDAGLTGPQPLLWEEEGFALADGYDETTTRYRALVLPTDDINVAITDATLIVRPDRATSQRAADIAASQPAGGTPDEQSMTGGSADPTDVPSTKPTAEGPPKKTRFFGSKPLDANRYATDFKKIADEVLAPLAAASGVTLKVTIEIEATSDDGFDDPRVRTVSENAATLKFNIHDFE